MKTSNETTKRNLYVHIEKSVHIAARQAALADGKPLGEVVEAALRLYLATREAPDAGR